MVKFVLYIKRSCYVRSGGRNFRYSVFTLIKLGNFFGIGRGKSLNLNSAIDKSYKFAYINKCVYNIINGTILSIVEYKIGSTYIKLIPSNKNIGLVVGGIVRTIIRILGFINVYCIIHGSKNRSNLIFAVYKCISFLNDKIN